MRNCLLCKLILMDDLNKAKRVTFRGIDRLICCLVVRIPRLRMSSVETEESRFMTTNSLLVFMTNCSPQQKKSVITVTIALMHVYVTQANFTTKPRFEIKNKRSFTEMNSQGSRVEKNTHAQKVQMQKILFTNEACWWNLLVWRNHA